MLWRNGCDGKVLRCGAGNRIDINIYIPANMPVERGSVNRCFQVEIFSQEVGCGKLGRGHRPISTARGNM
jgi:hypothetical protein